MKKLCALLLCAGAVAGCPNDKPPAAAVDPHDDHAEHHEAASGAEASTVRIDREMLRDLRITTTRVESRPGGEGVVVLGEVSVNQDAYAEIGSSIPGRVVRVLVRAGDKVIAGQPVVELQSVELGKARAAYLAAKARADLTRKTANRKATLADERIVAQSELQAVEAEALAATAEVRAARSALTALGASLQDVDNDTEASRLTLRSPIAGTVVERNASLGQVADPSKALLRVAELSALWLVVHAFERDAVRVRAGAVARVSLPALPGKSFEAKVAAVGQQVEAASRTIPVRLEIANPDGLLRPGMSANAWIPIGEEEAVVISVPAASLQRLLDGWFVFVPKDAASFETRAVGRGRDLGGEIEVLSGLKPGETVVVDGAFLLKAELEKSRGEGEHHEH